MVQDFCPLKIKITEFHGGFRLTVFISDKDNPKFKFLCKNELIYIRDFEAVQNTHSVLLGVKTPLLLFFKQYLKHTCVFMTSFPYQTYQRPLTLQFSCSNSPKNFAKGYSPASTRTLLLCPNPHPLPPEQKAVNGSRWGGWLLNFELISALIRSGHLIQPTWIMQWMLFLIKICQYCS